MKRSRITAVRKLREAFISLLVLVVIFGPMMIAGWWLVAVVRQPDPRQVVPLEVFHARSVDQTGQPVKPFDDPAVSITFDDGWESVYTTGLPLLQWYGFHSTQYVIANTATDTNYMSIAQLQALSGSGSEIGSHGVSHANLTTLSSSELARELQNSQHTLSNELDVPVREFASPYGAYDQYTLQAVATYYQSHMDSEGDVDPSAALLDSINTRDSFNPHNFISFTVHSTTTLAMLQKLIDLTVASHGWLVLTYHQIDESAEDYSVSPAIFARQLELLNNSPLRGVTVGQFMHAYAREAR